MANFLIKLIVKNSGNTANFKVRENYGKLAGSVGIVTNFLLFTIKLTVGLLANSISIIADAVNNLTDAGSSVVTLIGFKISGKPADAQHPYGHARMEYISGLIVSLTILFLGLQLFKSSVDKIITPNVTQFSIASIAVLIFSILLKLWQCLFYRKIGILIHSTTLTATSADSRNDILATSAVLVSVIINYFTKLDLDGYIGSLVSIFVTMSGFRLLMETTSPLLGLAPTREMVEKINKRILGYKNIIGLHDLSIHTYGVAKCFASVHCEVPAELDIMISHDIIDNIERDFLIDMQIHLVIHPDPVVTSDPKTTKLKQEIEDLIFQISPDIHMHDLRVVWGVSHSNLIFDIVIPYSFQWSEEELIKLIADKISVLDKNYRPMITIDYYSTLNTEKNT